VIKTFKHAGLENFYQTGSKRGIHPAHADKLENQLLALDAATCAEDMQFPGWHLHPLQREVAEHWSIRVNGNWRITFRFEGEDAILVDYQDYH
jgi:proteic killer suppression protein